jgi:hypothetical protein
MANKELSNFLATDEMPKTHLGLVPNGFRIGRKKGAE